MGNTITRVTFSEIVDFYDYAVNALGEDFKFTGRIKYEKLLLEGTLDIYFEILEEWEEEKNEWSWSFPPCTTRKVQRSRKRWVNSNEFEITETTLVNCNEKEN